MAYRIASTICRAGLRHRGHRPRAYRIADGEDAGADRSQRPHRLPCHLSNCLCHFGAHPRLQLFIFGIISHPCIRVKTQSRKFRFVHWCPCATNTCAAYLPRHRRADGQGATRCRALGGGHDDLSDLNTDPAPVFSPNSRYISAISSRAVLSNTIGNNLMKSFSFSMLINGETLFKPLREGTALGSAPRIATNYVVNDICICIDRLITTARQDNN